MTNSLSFAARLGKVIGTPIEQGMQILPACWHWRMHAAAVISIRAALRIVLGTMGKVPPNAAHDELHRLPAMGTGVSGGFLGPLTLLAELPVTTVSMLRAIADFAHSEGEDLSTPETLITCVQVFALGGCTGQDRSPIAVIYYV